MKTLLFGKKTIQTQNPAFVMGIVNCTPDSFFKESRGGKKRALRLIEEGADILDLGAESTRPGSDFISAEEEIKRLIPVLRSIRKESDIPISIDTRKKSVMEACYNEGADCVNDISALEDDEELSFFVKEKELSVILMHKRGSPRDMQKNTRYADVFNEVSRYLKERALFAQSCGISKERIIVDPGIGFAKDTESCVRLIAECGKLCGGEYPVLMALSRKSFLKDLTLRAVEDRLGGTLCANILSVCNGASLLRVHDVAATVDALKVLKAVGYSKGK